jgi:hypothetical protein
MIKQINHMKQTCILFTKEDENQETPAHLSLVTFLHMKNSFLVFSLIIVSIAFISCDDDKIVNERDLPAIAQAFLQAHFPDATVNLVEKDFDSYDVHLSNGFEVEFTKSGVWDDVKNYAVSIPASILALIPGGINEYVATNYPNQFMVGVNKERYGFDIDLNTGIELEFNTDGTFRRIDY